MNKPKILVIGSLNMDLILQTTVMPIAGENLIGSHYQYAHGGKGGNQAIAAAKLGADVTFVGKVGQDAFGDELVASLSEHGISTKFITRDAKSNTGLATIILEEKGQNRILVYPEANMTLTTAEIDKAFEGQDYDAMMIQFEIPEAVVIHACEKAREKGIPFIVDAGPAQDFPLEKILGAEIFSPNETETFALCQIEVTDLKSAEIAAKMLFKRCEAKYIVIKAGGFGAYIYDSETSTHIPALRVAAIDPTAAGDAFTAGMTVEYLQDNNIEKAVMYANGVGAVTVTKLGAQPSIPTRQEVEEFLKGRA